MRADVYMRVVFTVIAAALVYLCVVLTPIPTVHAQRGLRPGDDTGPAQVVVVGWRTTDRPAMEVAESIPLKMTGEVTVRGLVETRQTSSAFARVAVVGWEENAPQPAVLGAPPGTFRPFDSRANRGVPVTAWAP